VCSVMGSWKGEGTKSREQNTADICAGSLHGTQRKALSSAHIEDGMCREIRLRGAGCVTRRGPILMTIPCTALIVDALVAQLAEE
jgi:hypothetical protein